MSNNMIEKKCIICGSKDFQIKSENYCSFKCIASNAAIISNKRKCKCEICNNFVNIHNIKKHLKFHIEKADIENKIFVCENCGEEFKGEYGKSNRFCSKKCARGFSTKENRLEINKKISLKLYKGENIKNLELICSNCGKIFFHKNFKKFCSNECKNIKLHNFFSLAGRKSVELQKIKRRSKNEIYFYELCKNYYNNVKCNENIFNGWDADIIIEDFKIAILWNGKWHYEKITKKHSVEQVQKRDQIKIYEIIKMGYTPYIIKDLGKYNSVFVENEFIKFKLKYNYQK